MRRRLFWSIFAVAMAVFAACSAVSLGALYGYHSEQLRRQLEQETVWLAAAVESAGTGFLYGSGDADWQRVTLIDTDGDVLYDSDVDPDTMENHGRRDEVVQARAAGNGWSVRYSGTLETRTLNYALLLTDGSVLRVSCTEQTLPALLAALWLPLLLVAVLALVLALVLSWRTARALVRPVNAIDLERPDEGAVYPELRPLIARINEQNRQIRRQMELLTEEHRRQDRMRQEFTANVSHELKTPLTSISGYAELMREGIARPEDVPGFAARIYDEAQRLQNLVGDIIQLSRLEEADSPLAETEIDLYQLCRQVAQRFRLPAERQSVTIAAEGGAVAVRASERVLTEMVGNLCDNAIKYNRPGGRVTLRAAREGGCAVLTVEDTGIGIPPEDQARVFERFYRVDKSHSRAVGGTGLGLSIVKHGAARHQIALSLESRPGEGTRVTLRFPPERLIQKSNISSGSPD